MKPTIQTEYYKCRPVKVLSKRWGLFLFCLLFVFCGFMIWQLFSTQIKNAIHYVQGDKFVNCSYDLPGKPGKYCLEYDKNKNIVYCNSTSREYIK